eukprot:Phypoly_transcript_17978.p1 GENE.Phypoly_transcript_17978~~Phypoly_transcript_17978.p1  ORF type:complete len:185 (+),score=8.15 Phypoly_transcript_17978:167-721(+)
MGHRLLFSALITGGLALGFVIASWSMCWYDTQQDFPNTKTKYYWKKYTIHYLDNHTHHNYNLEPKAKQLFTACLTLLTIGGGFLVAFLVFTILRIMIFRNSKLFHVIGAILGVAASALLSVAFLTFLRMPIAFKEDAHCPHCEHSFRGSNKSAKWGPGPGWWMLVGAIVLSLISAVKVLKKVIR